MTAKEDMDRGETIEISD